MFLNLSLVIYPLHILFPAYVAILLDYIPTNQTVKIFAVHTLHHARITSI